MSLVLLSALACLHAGFQVTVTVLVYPALADVPDDRWVAAHDRHSRRIVPLVVVAYGSLLVTGAVALLTVGPAAATDALAAGELAAWSALAGTVCLLGVGCLTAFAAAPLHGRLSGDPRSRPDAGAGSQAVLVRRLLRWDRWRAVLAVGAAVAFVAAAAV